MSVYACLKLSCSQAVTAWWAFYQAAFASVVFLASCREAYPSVHYLNTKAGHWCT